MTSAATASSVRAVLAAVSTCLIVLAAASAAFAQPIQRLPAEFEPQEAIWLQWPGRFEKTREHGNLEFNGLDTVLLNWNAIGNPHRGNGYADKAEAEVDLKNHFGVTKIVWADGPITGDATGGHIDSIVRFIDAERDFALASDYLGREMAASPSWRGSHCISCPPDAA